MELLGALKDVSPLIATIVVLTLLAVLVIEKMTSATGPWTRFTSWLANREVARARREAALEDEVRKRADGQVSYLVSLVDFYKQELVRTSAEMRAAVDSLRVELEHVRSEYASARKELEIVHHLLDETRHEASAANRRLAELATVPLPVTRLENRS